MDGRRRVSTVLHQLLRKKKSLRVFGEHRRLVFLTMLGLLPLLTIGCQEEIPVALDDQAISAYRCR